MLGTDACTRPASQIRFYRRSRHHHPLSPRRQIISEPDFIEKLTTGSRSVVSGVIRTARPKQWVKNLLVLAAPLAAGILITLPTAVAAAIAFVSFCLSASAVYFVNDLADIDADRAHPKKKHRPIASGIVPHPLAVAVTIVLFVAGLAVAAGAGAQLVVVILCYDLIQLAYCFWLKHVSILDIAVVSSGFLLRAVAGGVATDALPTQWFLLVAVFGSLLIVAGKRYGEIIAERPVGTPQRGSLKHYTPSYLRFVWQASAAILILSYSLWAFGEGNGRSSLWLSLSVAPFLLAVIRFCQHIDRGDAEAPEDIAMHDRMLQVLAVLWVLMLAIGVYFKPFFH